MCYNIPVNTSTSTATPEKPGSTTRITHLLGDRMKKTTGIIIEKNIDFRKIMLFVVVLIAGLWLLMRRHIPVSPRIARPPEIIITGAVMVFASCQKFTLTETELITYLAFLPIRRTTPEGIRQISLIPASKENHPGILFVLDGCERFDRESQTVFDFTKKHPFASVCFFVAQKDIMAFVEVVEKHWGQIEGKYLLHMDD